MPIQTINIGTAPDDGTGDSLRLAFDKANSNFITLNSEKLANTNGTTYQGNLTFTHNITVGNTVFAAHFDNVSDIKLKENIVSITNALDIIERLNPVTFTWKKDGKSSYGLIAQEVELSLPTIVHQMEDGTKAVNYVEIIAILVSAIQSLQKEILTIKGNH
jgi:hypothetical protein